MTPPREQLEVVRKQIIDAYYRYIQNVSHPQMAISLETATWVGLLAQNAQSAVDFGSGFTSYVLRTYCENVWSVDDNEEWLGKTVEFCRAENVGTENIVLIGDYRSAKHDLVVMDYAGGETRNDLYPFALAQLAPGGIGVFDDMQHGPHRDAAQRAAEHSGLTLVSAKGWTSDQYSRWASYAVR